MGLTVHFSPAAPGTKTDPAKILLADDDKAVLNVYTELLEGEGYKVTGVRDGEKAMQLLATLEFDAVITDIVLPGINGLLLLRRAKGLQPNTPVIVMTGYPLSDLEPDFRDSGAFAFLSKPVPRTQLLTTLKVALAARARKPFKRPLVEIFVGGNPLDEVVIQQVLRFALPFAEAMVYDIRKTGMGKAKEYRIPGVPSVVIDGKFVDCVTAIGVNLEKLKAAGLGPQSS
ncbi:MAG: response regulator [bacterium]